MGPLDMRSSFASLFHRAIFEASGSGVLLRIWDSLAFEVRTRVILEYLTTINPRTPMKTFLGLLTTEMKLAIAGVLVLAAISPAAFSAVPVDGPEYVLENASIRLGLKDNRIVSLFDKVRSIRRIETGLKGDCHEAVPVDCDWKSSD